MKFLASSLLVAVVASTASATTVFFKNLCDDEVELYDNRVVVPLAPGAGSERFLPMGFMGIFRHGKDPRATLAEFTMEDGKAWYDISIIPTNTNGRGPDLCSSLDACKAHTGGGWGYNIQMEMHPHTNQNGAYCRTLTCMHDGCDDAYQFPKDDTKTHNCPYGTNFDVVFCPGGTGGQTPPPTEPPTPEPTTPEPTTPAPTNATEERSMDDLFDSSLGGGSQSIAGEEESATIDAPAPTVTTKAPTPSPTATEAPTVEANTQAEASSGSATATVFLVLGGVAAVAGIAMIVVIRRKKAALDAMEDKNSIALRTSTAAL